MVGIKNFCCNPGRTWKLSDLGQGRGTIFRQDPISRFGSYLTVRGVIATRQFPSPFRQATIRTRTRSLVERYEVRSKWRDLEYFG